MPSRVVAFIAAQLLLMPAAAPAQAKCEIKSWRYYEGAESTTFIIEGVTTCETGTIRIQVYDGANKWLGNTLPVGIEPGGTFKTLVRNVVAPQKMVIQYTIAP